MYPIRRFSSQEGPELLVHPCCDNRLEFWTSDGSPVVLDAQTFDKITRWIAEHREAMAARKVYVN